MNYDQINAYVAKCLGFTASELAFFNNLLRPRKVAKKTLLLRYGEICAFEAYVVKGCLKSYYVDDKGDEVILTFAAEDWWVSDIASFHDQTPSRMFIEALEDSELLMLSPEAKETLLQRIPKFERVFRIMVQRNLAAYQERLYANIAKPAQERYADFLKKHPSLPQRVPQKQIAAYLGISPEFLSKIRRVMRKK